MASVKKCTARDSIMRGRRRTNQDANKGPASEAGTAGTHTVNGNVTACPQWHHGRIRVGQVVDLLITSQVYQTCIVHVRGGSNRFLFWKECSLPRLIERGERVKRSSVLRASPAPSKKLIWQQTHTYWLLHASNFRRHPLLRRNNHLYPA
jgi:hypothetical protein